MHPELFHLPIFGTPINSYGVMMVIGFLLGAQLAKYLARRSGLDGETIMNAGLIALVTGVIGARLSHVLENWSDFTNDTFWNNVYDAINIRSGGLTYYGGVLLATPLTIAYGLYKRFPIRLGMDMIAPALMIGLGFGRIGCLLNGCCYGAACDLPSPLGVTYPYRSNAYIEEFHNRTLKDRPPDAMVKESHGADGQVILTLKSRDDIAADPSLSEADKRMLLAKADELRSNKVHNAQTYSTITALLLAALLTAYYTIPHVPGRVFALMMILEGGTRFLLELLRAEPPAIEGIGGFFATWSLSMFIGLGLFVGGIALWFAFNWDRPKVFPPLADTPTPTPALI